MADIQETFQELNVTVLMRLGDPGVWFEATLLKIGRLGAGLVRLPVDRGGIERWIPADWWHEPDERPWPQHPSVGYGEFRFSDLPEAPAPTGRPTTPATPAFIEPRARPTVPEALPEPLAHQIARDDASAPEPPAPTQLGHIDMPMPTRKSKRIAS